VGSVVRSWAGFRVVLHAEHRAVEQAQALDHSVVEVDVADDRRAVRGAEWLPGLIWHVGPGHGGVARFRGNVLAAGGPFLMREGGGEAAVVAGDVDAPSGEVHHRLVDAAVAVPGIIGSHAGGPGEDLPAQADAE